jgi:putative DNA-invertase from lambdoid prophage Rac
MEQINKCRVAIYCRVSTAEQTTANQRIRLEDYAKTKGWEYDVYEETESTRKTRPVKQHLMAKLRAGEYSKVLVYKLDRFARSSKELIMDVDIILRKNIGFISISDNLDFTTASGKLQFLVLSAFADFERELIRERTIEGLKRARTQGKMPGRPKGSKDSVKRKKSGYILREAFKRKKKDEGEGEFKHINNYLP